MARLAFFLLVIAVSRISHGQQPQIGHISVEYVWVQHQVSGTDQGIVVFKDSSYRSRLQQIIINAVRKISPEGEPGISITYHPLTLFRGTPKFKPEVKERDATKRFMFLQLFDRLNYYKHNNDTAVSSSIAVKYQLRSGDDSLLEAKAFKVNVSRMPVSPGQMPLNRVIAYPMDYMSVIDSIVAWCIGQNPPNDKLVQVDCAAVYDETSNSNIHAKKILSHDSNDVVYITGDEEIELHKMQSTFTLMGQEKNIVENSLGAILTGFTGIPSNKIKYYRYAEDITFSDNRQLYHCFVTYLQASVASRTRVKNSDGSKSLQLGHWKWGRRYIESSSENYIITNGDTLCTFYATTRYTEGPYKKMWNGYDTATIIELPAAWNNERRKVLGFAGNIGADSFCLESVNDGNLKKVFIREELVATFYGNPSPAYATLHVNVNGRQLKLFVLLALIATRFHPYD